MGSSFGWHSRKALVAELLDGNVLASKSTAYGKHLWVVFDPTEGESYLCLFLLMNRNGDWGYKPISENMGPNATDCPLSLLELTPVADADWRDRVRKAVKAGKRKFAAGDRVDIYGKEYEVTGPYKRSFLLRKVMDDGTLGYSTYKSTAKKMRLVSEVKAEKEARIAELEAAPFGSIAAWGDWHEAVPQGFVGLLATKGANREGYGDRKHVLVPAARYDNHSYVLTGTERTWANPPA